MTKAPNRCEIIEAMCVTWRHDFGIDRINDALVVGCGMSEGEREFLRREMGQLFDHHIAPAVEQAVAAERAACLAVVESHGANNAKVRCIADDIRRRSQEASLEGAASAGAS
jgi:hypothetical protein